MVYVGKWSGGFSGGITGGGHCSGSSSIQCMRPASPLIELEEPSRASFVLIFWRSLQDEVFNYSCLLLPRQLDGAAVLNNCPSYSIVTVYSFCVVLCHVLSSHVFLDFLGMVFHA